MTLNLVVPIGEIRIVVCNEMTKAFYSVHISHDNYQRVTIKPGLWVAFKGISEYNMLLNIASIAHNPSEAKNIAIDISGLSVSKNKNGSFKKYTGEKSLAQKFDSDNYGQHDEDLDDLFKHSEASKVVDAFKSILIKKYEKVFVENKVKSIYILNFIFNNNDKEIYLSVLKVDKDRINNFTAGNISKTTCVFNNAINIDYGEIKAYKAKKRLELRLNINGLIEANCIYKIKYSFGGKVRKINFRDELIKDKKFINNLSEAQAINIFYE